MWKSIYIYIYLYSVCVWLKNVPMIKFTVMWSVEVRNHRREHALSGCWCWEDEKWRGGATMSVRVHVVLSHSRRHEDWRERAEASGSTAPTHHVSKNTPWCYTPAGCSLSIYSHFPPGSTHYCEGKRWLDMFDMSLTTSGQAAIGFIQEIWLIFIR